MALDPYTLCPCGSGKKLKFCECAAESAELEKVLIAIEGDQRVAALDMLNRYLASKPNHKAFLSLKSSVQLFLSQFEEARKTIEQFIAVAPKNPLALLLSAFCDIQLGKLREAILKIQRGLENCSTTNLPALLPNVLVALVQDLFQQEKYAAAFAHLRLRLSLQDSEESDQRAALTFMQLCRATDIPLIFKNFNSPRPAPDTAPYKTELDSAMKLSPEGCWLSLLPHLESLEKKYPQDSLLLYNIALCQSNLLDDRSPATWHRFATAPGTSALEALDAEMQAQTITPHDERDAVQQIRIIYKVKDVSTLQERFASDKRLDRMHADLQSMVEEGSPPPRAAYWLLDRESSTYTEQLTPEEIPNTLGEILLFGKETDRDARLEFTISKTTEMLAKVRRLQEVGGDQLGMIEKEEKIGTEYILDEALTIRWRIPEGTPAEAMQKLLAEKQAHNIYHVLPSVPLQLFGGKSAREIAAEPQYRLALSALIRTYELQYRQLNRSIDFNELRRQLGVPALELIDPTTLNIEELSITQYDLVDVSKLSNPQLAQLFTNSTRMNVVYAIQRLAQEALQRDPAPAELPKHRILFSLAQNQSSLDDSLRLVLEAQQAAVAAGTSPASMLLFELDLRLARREVDEIQRIVMTLQTKHMREPMIAESLYSKLVEWGVLNPDGSLRGAPPVGAAPELSPNVASSSIWSPDVTATPPAKEGGSKLWLPGLD